MIAKVLYKEQDISFILMTKIEHVVRLVAEHDSIGFESAYAEFIASDVHHALMTPDSLYWTESAEFIVDEFFRSKSALSS